MPKHGKKFRATAKKIDPDKVYSLEEAVKLAVDNSTTSFDGTLEVHVNTGTDPKHADQMIRANLVLPHGTGKTKRIAVFCDASKEAEAKKAGADVVGEDDLIEKVEKGSIDFDIVIAQPAMMKKLAKIAKILGPKGLMPSPKAGSVTEDIGRAVEEIKKGKIEFRNDKFGIVHSVLGKVSFGDKKLIENAAEFIKTLKNAKPAVVKGTYIKKISISTTMGPGIFVDIQSA